MVQVRIVPTHSHLNYCVQFAESGVAPDLNPTPNGQFGILQRHFDLVDRGGVFTAEADAGYFLTAAFRAVVLFVFVVFRAGITFIQ